MEQKSKFLSYLLRHKPEAKGLQLDKEGWIAMVELVQKAGFTFSELEEITLTDEKQRYTILDGYIRANQGHSTKQVKVTFDRAVPPPVLYHGTSYENLPRVQKEGLKPMSRHHVHLSAELATAKDVAGRRKGDISVLQIDCAKMLKDGVQFYKSENNVWLVDEVKPTYFKVLP